MELEYLPFEEFEELPGGNRNPLMYFTFDTEKECIYYYTYSDMNGATDYMSSSVNYKTLANMCSMPYNFLFALLQTTNDPEWVMAVVDQLLLESEAVILIQDQMTTTVTVETYNHIEKTVTTDEDEDGNKHEHEPEYISVYDGFDRTVSTQYTARAFIAKANTWCMNYEQTATLTQMSNNSSQDMDPEDPTSYTYTKIRDDGETATYRSDETYLKSLATTTTSITCKIDVTQEREISDKFLSTWKNISCHITQKQHQYHQIHYLK